MPFSGKIPVRLISAQADEVADRDDLEERLELAETLGLEHLPRSGGDETQAGDQEFANEDEHHAKGRIKHRGGVRVDVHPRVVDADDGQTIDGGEADEQAKDEDLVDQGIHQAAEVGHGVQLPGDPAVKDVGQGGQDE
ncbi:MAG: hypothetical protein RLZZ23_1248 [Verrucomicrobiota bacterium]